MPSRTMVALFLLASTVSSAQPPPRRMAPDIVPHPTAMFLASLSGDGRQQVVFKAAAMGTHFFFEEPTGVTVYFYDGRGYRKQTFLKGYTLTRAIKKFAGTG
ncbi:MAG TPA: hypothetical protein VER58_10700 [Thermoanaerobaculia bacterium]|nr:hypothetical protein [Thermoanaerobaculia bacterium]